MPKDKIKPLSNIRHVRQSIWDRFSGQATAMKVLQPELLDYFTRQLQGHIQENGEEAMKEIVQSYRETTDG